MGEPPFTPYDERCAEVYDAWFTAHEAAAGEDLAELAQGGPALELGIGTGLVALPLAARGVAVHGVDNSEAMVGKLRAKPGGAAIPVTLGNFADVPVEGEFSLIFVVFNTFFALLEQQEQVRCFRNVAAHLASGGVFVVEAFVPDLASFTGRQNVKALTVTGDRVGLKVSRHDPVAQRLMSQHVVFTHGEVRLYPVEVRYVWPAEMDLMAELAGLRLRQRWGSWERDAFRATSERQIAVYERSP